MFFFFLQFETYFVYFFPFVFIRDGIFERSNTMSRVILVSHVNMLILIFA